MKGFIVGRSATDGVDDDVDESLSSGADADVDVDELVSRSILKNIYDKMLE